MRSAVFCYAAADVDCARELADYLELNCGLMVSLSEGKIESGCDLIERAGRALSADYPVLLLSPDSVPKVWNREEWEEVLFKEAHELGREVAYVLLRPCKFPDLFRRPNKPFFDLSKQEFGGQQTLRRWLLQQDPLAQRATNIDETGIVTREAKALRELEPLLDRPGVRSQVERELALAFAQAHLEDFEGVFWLDCTYRSRAGILGVAGEALGLSLRGQMEENAGRLREFCAGHRLLLVFEHLTPEDAAFVTTGEKTSFLVVQEQDPPPPASVETTAAVFADWRKGADACLRLLGDAHWHIRNLNTYEGERWNTAATLGSTAASFLQDRDRLAEAYEFLETTREGLRAKGDSFKAARLQWEMSWIREEWGEAATPNSRMVLPALPLQLSLAFRE